MFFIDTLYKNAKARALLSEWADSITLYNDHLALDKMSESLSRTLFDDRELLSDFFDMGLNDAINNESIGGLRLPSGLGFPDFLRDSLASISEEDFEILKEYTISRVFNDYDVRETKNLVLSGGGAKGFGYPGVLRTLDSLPSYEGVSVYDNISEVSGASSGALIGLPVALGFSPQEIESVIYNNNFEQFFDESVVTSSGYRGELARLTKKMSSSFKDRFSEVDYLDVYTRSMNRLLINHIIETQLSHYSGDKDDSLVEKERIKIKNEIKILNSKYTDDLVGYLDNEGLLDDWDKISKKEASDVVLNGSNSNRPEFKAFPDSASAMKYSIRRYSKRCNIEEFFGDLIEQKIGSISDDDLDSVCPSLVSIADNSLVSRVCHILRNNAASVASEIKSNPDNVDKWRDEFRSILHSKAPDFDRNENHNYENENYIAVSAISDMKSYELMSVVENIDSINDCQLNEFAIKNILNKSYEAQRNLYIRNINFNELSSLVENFPEMGFKNLHVSMCRLDPVNLSDIPFSSDGMREVLAKRYNLQIGNRFNPELSSMPIKTAARISMNIPVGFEKMVYGDSRYVDGGVVSNSPTQPFINNNKDESNKTLVLMMGDGGFFKQGKDLKSALKKTQMTKREKVGLINPINWYIPIKKAFYWSLFSLNQNLGRLSLKDLWNTAVLDSGDVTMKDFSLSRNNKSEIMSQFESDFINKFRGMNNAQSIFLRKRIDHLEDEVDKEGVFSGKDVSVEAPGAVNIREGVFSSRDMKRIHGDMVDKDYVNKVKDSVKKPVNNNDCSETKKYSGSFCSEFKYGP